jgi:hypothetical protein
VAYLYAVDLLLRQRRINFRLHHPKADQIIDPECDLAVVLMMELSRQSPANPNVAKIVHHVTEEVPASRDRCSWA